jgi:hypothetical protein
MQAAAYPPDPTSHSCCLQKFTGSRLRYSSHPIPFTIDPLFEYPKLKAVDGNENLGISCGVLHKALICNQHIVKRIYSTLCSLLLFQLALLRCPFLFAFRMRDFLLNSRWCVQGWRLPFISERERIGLLGRDISSGFSGDFRVRGVAWSGRKRRRRLGAGMLQLIECLDSGKDTCTLPLYLSPISRPRITLDVNAMPCYSLLV